MGEGKFRAHVQYNDWTGTASADNADAKDFYELLEKKGLMDRDKDFLIGLTLWIGENHGGDVKPPYISAVFVSGNLYDEIEPKLQAAADPIQTRKVDVELTLNEFVGLFKRFAVVLTARGLDLTDREYEFPDEDEE